MSVENQDRTGATLPDWEGLNKECSARAKKTLAYFQRLSGASPDTAVRDLLHELMHFCDRKGRQTTFGEELGWAYSYYEDCATEHLRARPSPKGITINGG